METNLKRWRELKAIENQAQKERLKIEEEIYTQFIDQINPSGSNTINTDNFKLKIQCGINRKWDQKQLEELKFVDGFEQAFKVEYKEDKKEFDKLPQEIKKQLNEALTETIKKPTFTIEDL